ncbi:MAG: hypothetical protein K8L99_29425 [Anaerolineae bacterium]|nr:hypothetical protein [Anaerolineae bacterium]
MSMDVLASGGTNSEEFQRATLLSEWLMPKTTQTLRGLSAIAALFLGWLAVPLEVFIRYGQGERYMGLLRMFYGFGMIQTFFMIVIAVGLPYRYTQFTELFLLAYVMLAVAHQMQMWRRARAKIPWHSRAFGISHLQKLTLRLEAWLIGKPVPFLNGRKVPPFNISDWVLYRFIEPVTFVLLGLALRQYEPLVGLYLLVASAALFVKNNHLYNMERDRILDIIDAQIEQTYLQDALDGKPKEKTAGFTVAPVTYPDFPAEDAPDIAATVARTMGAAAGRNTQAAPAEGETAAEPDAEAQLPLPLDARSPGGASAASGNG